MIKILEQYRNKPTLANARKVRAYGRSHPYSACFLPPEMADLLANAIHHANKG